MTDWLTNSNASAVNTLREQFNACDLTVEKQTDITANVLTALQLDNARKLELIDAWIPRVFHRPFQVFAGIAGTRSYAGLESGKLRYLSAQLAKSSPHAPNWSRTQGPAPHEGDHTLGSCRSLRTLSFRAPSALPLFTATLSALRR